MNDENIKFNSSNVFTALALFNQLTVPLFIFPITIPIIISSLISTRRIERFLSQTEIEKKELEGVNNMARVLSKNNDSLDDDQKSANGDDEDDGEESSGKEKLFELQRDTIDEEEIEIKINLDTNERGNVHGAIKEEAEDEEEQHCDGIKPPVEDDDEVVILRNKNNRVKLRKQNQLSESGRLERNRLRSTTAVDKHSKSGSIHRLPSFKVPDGVAICINNAKFSWDGRKDSNVLEIENLSIPLGIKPHIITFNELREF